MIKRLSHVGARVDALLGVLRKSDFESLLDILQDLLILRSADEGDGKTLGTETTGATYTVQVRVGICRQIVIDGKVDPLNIDTTSEHVCGDTDTLVEFLELFVALDTGGSLVLNFLF
jgi:hypothetical protein